MDRVSAALGQDSAYQLPWPDVAPLGAALSPLKSKYLTSQSGQLGMLLIRIHRSDDQFAQGNEGIDQVRRLIDEVQTQHSDVTIGLTGMPVLENDEMRASQQDMARASLLSLFGVACLFIAGFGGLRYPMMTVATLIIAIAWSFGYITVAIGTFKHLERRIQCDSDWAGDRLWDPLRRQILATSTSHGGQSDSPGEDCDRSWTWHCYRRIDHGVGFLDRGFDRLHWRRRVGLDRRWRNPVVYRRGFARIASHDSPVGSTAST